MRQIEQVGQMLARHYGAGQGRAWGRGAGMFDEAYKPLIEVGERGSWPRSTTVGGPANLRGEPGPAAGGAGLRVLKAEADLYAGAGQPGGGGAALPAGPGPGRLPGRPVGCSTGGWPASWSGPRARRRRPSGWPPARVLEALGRFADAEDALFEVIDDQPGDPAPVEEAIAFCQRLRPLEPDRLEAGGLSTGEVNDALAELPPRAGRRRGPLGDLGAGQARRGCRGRAA